MLEVFEAFEPGSNGAVIDRTEKPSEATLRGLRFGKKSASGS